MAFIFFTNKYGIYPVVLDEIATWGIFLGINYTLELLAIWFPVYWIKLNYKYVNYINLLLIKFFGRVGEVVDDPIKKT